METTPHHTRALPRLGGIAVALCVACCCETGMAKVSYPPISTMSDFERASLEARLTTLATLGANESDGCDRCDVKLAVFLDVEKNRIWIDLVGGTTRVENEFDFDRLGEGIERRVNPLVERISGVEGVTCRSGGYAFCGRLGD